MTRTITALALGALLCMACNKDSGGAGGAASAAASGSAKPTTAAPGASKHKLKTQLTGAQLEDAYATLIKGNNDFKKHQEKVTAKLGAPAKVDGDQAFWYGVVPANGPMPEDCMQLSTSPTKGSGTQTTNGDDKCWEKQ
jgi:hypothetical protein